MRILGFLLALVVGRFELSPDRFCSKHVLKVDAFLSHGEELRRIEAENYQII